MLVYRPPIKRAEELVRVPSGPQSFELSKLFLFVDWPPYHGLGLAESGSSREATKMVSVRFVKLRVIAKEKKPERLNIVQFSQACNGKLFYPCLEGCLIIII